MGEEKERDVEWAREKKRIKEGNRESRKERETGGGGGGEGEDTTRTIIKCNLYLEKKGIWKEDAKEWG